MGMNTGLSPVLYVRGSIMILVFSGMLVSTGCSRNHCNQFYLESENKTMICLARFLFHNQVVVVSFWRLVSIFYFQ